MKRFAHPILILYIGLAGILFLATACEDNLDFSRKVTFTAAGGYQNGPQTKTAYSDAEFTEGTKKYERIDWVVNDLIRIASDKAQTPAGEAFADYKVTNVSGTSSRISNAEIETVGNNGLNWGTGTNTFYALYPAPSTDGAQSGVDITTTNTGATFTGVIPATQNVTLRDTIYQPDMRCAYMWAAKSASQGGNVDLAFQPAMTTFEFTIGNPESTTMTVTRLRVSSSSKALCGTFTGTVNKSTLACTYACPDLSTSGNQNDRLTVNFSPALSIPSGSFKTVTLLALPQDLTNLTVTLTINGGETRKLELKNASGIWYTFNGTKKYHIALGVPTSYDYTFTVSSSMGNLPYSGYTGSDADYTVTSYRKLNGSAVLFGRGWTTEYSTDNGTTWSTTKPEWLTTFTESQTSSQAGTTAKSYRAVIRAITGHNTHSDALRNATPRGTETNPFDLSTHKVNGSANSGNKQTTANCYVVSAPGWYAFPLVYGNAIKGGNENTTAYQPNLSGTGVLTKFKKHSGNITTSAITGTDRARLVWQDAENLVTNISKISLHDSDYIKFYINPETICQGNAVIAAQSSNGTTLWSWHIWVTDQSMTNQTPSSNNWPGTASFMPVNLGWCDGGTITWTARNVRVRFTQESSNLQRTITIRQNGHTTTLLGNCPYYQWGRKDPMLPAKGENVASNDNKTYYNASGVSSTKIEVQKWQSGTTTLSWAIKNPFHLILNVLNDSSASDWCDSHYVNLWNSASKATGGSVTAIGKTVYDPCPPGYVVPPSGVVTTSNPSMNTYDATWNWYNRWSMYWPVVGCRLRLEGTAPAYNDGGQRVTGYGNQRDGYGKLYLSTQTDDDTQNGYILLFGCPSYENLSNYEYYQGKIAKWAGQGKATACPVRCIAE